VLIRCLASSLAFAGVLAAAAADARAETCAPAARLEGDAELVASVGRELAARGIVIERHGGAGAGDPATAAAAAAETCAPVRVQIERVEIAAADDATLIITIAVGDGAAVERNVRGLRTAATVIESFARTDVGSPLLAIRAIEPPAPSPAEPAGPKPAAAPMVQLVVHTRSRASYHLFIGPEVTFASDDSRWLGAQLGACIVLGPVCVGARLRGGVAVGTPEVWPEGTRRHTNELLLGLDVPLHLGAVTVIPGFSAGFGGFNTKGPGSTQNPALMDEIEVETGGLRADAHVSVAIPLWGRLALDLSVAVDLAQQTEPFEGVDDRHQIPPEPLALARFGIGVRYEVR
jgi:hypothetical protein